MAQSYTKIWIHAVWTTKDKKPIIYPKIERRLLKFLSDELNTMDCHVKIINAMPEHVHCLFLLNPQISLSNVMKNIKGGSSHFVNYHNLIKEKFSWQNGYSAFAVSDSLINRTIALIQNQKTFHKLFTFETELNNLFESHQIETYQYK
ncbi:MAG: IS200/IS605 family transposase [Bacteroidia bacterium]